MLVEFWLVHPFQPGLDNVQTSLQRRNSSLAKIQAKINKLEDEVICSLYKLLVHINVCMYFNLSFLPPMWC